MLGKRRFDRHFVKICTLTPFSAKSNPLFPALRSSPTAVQEPPAKSKFLAVPGVYKLRTTLTDWDDETLWRTYTMLTDLESVFRSLKSELGMRPVYHHKEDRCDGHLFITVLACLGSVLDFTNIVIIE